MGRSVCDDFQVAAERARQRVGNRVWDQMTTHEKAEAIYREMRALDAEHSKQPRDDLPPE